MSKTQTPRRDLLRGLRRARDWAGLAARAATMDLQALREMRAIARRQAGEVGAFLDAADRRLALPRVGSRTFPRPPGADWAWRPDLWCLPAPSRGFASVTSGTHLGAEVALFHDCPLLQITIAQVRNLREADLAPFGLQLDVFRFGGSYLSLALELPAEALAGLGKNHVFRIQTTVEMETPLEIFARLNIKHGPNTEQIVRELPLGTEEVMVEFDLAYTKLNEKRVEKMWLDLIFEGPQMNQVTLRDLTFSRRPRAEL